MVFLMTISMPTVTVTLVIIASMAVMRDVFVVVPVVAHEVDRYTACIIFCAMLSPVLFMPGRYVQVDRLGRNIRRRAYDHDRLGINNRRARNIANVDLSVETWLPNGDRHAHIGA